MTDDPDDIEKRWQDVLNIPAKQPSVKVLRLLRQREKRSAAEKKALAKVRQAAAVHELVEDVVEGIVRQLQRRRGSPAVIGKQEILAYLGRQLASKGGKKGGRKGGTARMDALTAEERSELGRKAAAARWGKRRSGL